MQHTPLTVETGLIEVLMSHGNTHRGQVDAVVHVVEGHVHALEGEHHALLAGVPLDAGQALRSLGCVPPAESPSQAPGAGTHGLLAGTG